MVGDAQRVVGLNTPFAPSLGVGPGVGLCGRATTGAGAGFDLAEADGLAEAEVAVEGAASTIASCVLVAATSLVGACAGSSPAPVVAATDVGLASAVEVVVGAAARVELEVIERDAIARPMLPITAAPRASAIIETRFLLASAVAASLSSGPAPRNMPTARVESEPAS